MDELILIINLINKLNITKHKTITFRVQYQMLSLSKSIFIDSNVK